MSLHLHCCDCPVCVTEVDEWEKSVSLHLHDVTVAVLSAWQKSVSDRSWWVFRCIIVAVLFAWQKSVSLHLYYFGCPVCVTEDGECSFALLWLSCLRNRRWWVFICTTVAVLFTWQKSVNERGRRVLICIAMTVLFAWQNSVSLHMHTH